MVQLNHVLQAASIGYDKHHPKARRTALRWKSIYRGYFPFKWHKDNFTKNLANYYGFSRVNSAKRLFSIRVR